MEKEILEKLLLEKKEAKKVMKRPAVDSVRTMNHLETEESFLVKTNKNLISYS